MSEENSSGLPSDVNINKMKVVDIRKLLKTHGLSTEGNKSELIQRFRDNCESLTKKGFVASESGEFDEDLDKSPTNEDSLMKSLSDEEEDVASSPPESKEVDPSMDEDEDPPEASGGDDLKCPESPLKKKRVHVSVEQEGGPTKKQMSAPSSSSGEDSVEVKDGTITDASANLTTSTTTKKVIKFNDAPAREKLVKRAEKFGLTELAKKEMRAARFGIQTPAVMSEVLKKRAERFGASSNTKVPEEDVLKKRAQRFGIVSPPPSSGKVEKKLITPLKGRVRPEGGVTTEEKRMMRSLRFNVATT